MRLLLAEDEKELSDALVTVLKHNNYSVDAVYNGEDALDYLNADNYDGAILDIMMPKVDGLKTLKVIRGLEKQYATPPEDHLKIIMMTAISDVDYVKEAFKLGCDAYASKPIDVQKVEEVMKHIGLLQAVEAVAEEE